MLYGEKHMSVIGSASEQVASALVRCGRLASKQPVATEALVVDGYSMTVAVRNAAGDDRLLHPTGVVARVMFRVDEARAKIKKLPLGTALDQWLLRQEQAINALVLPWNNHSAAFGGHALFMDAQRDAPHIVTMGTIYRASKWLITKRWR